ncbi:MAG: histidine--tRNA ligase, partial [candidate division Zixibacteria bacterium]|nr:histidine--tRNA ligase [candidate division Zixibacteria bacterium]NIR66696.1 histidine--tRNA ligase [candidate division Zixibacteria bacterium]NIS14880.1 histidine--tRNA ligase [candidate division Zixibacteria bacterium]NIS48235.1 histidine--tRNA ligase [candidate division Zixibacteria bacterium]NIT51399.1 histidine--tRNA ligase [candidate division Zixibacteria bacterium]
MVAELGPGRVDKSGDEIPGLNLKPEQISCIENFLDIPRRDFEKTFKKCSELLGEYEIARRGLDELKEIHEYLMTLGFENEQCVFDTTVVRGLGYYTGPIFETILTDLPEFGSVFAGGRYDNLVGRFSGQEAPGTGASIGVDRLLAALQKLGLIEGQKTSTD